MDPFDTALDELTRTLNGNAQGATPAAKPFSIYDLPKMAGEAFNSPNQNALMSFGGGADDKEQNHTGIFGKAMGSITGAPFLDADGARGRQTWTNALANTAHSVSPAGLYDMAKGVYDSGNRLLNPADDVKGFQEQGELYRPTDGRQQIMDAFNVASALPVGRAVASARGGLAPDVPMPNRAAMPETKNYDFYRGGAINTGYDTAWGSSSKEVAEAYANHPARKAAHLNSGVMTDAEARFTNPLIVDANGAAFGEINAPRYMRNTSSDKYASTDQFARYAAANGHDGLIVKNVMDGPFREDVVPVADTIAALKRGTIFDKATGQQLYSNGGDAKTAAAVGALGQGERQPGFTAYHGSPHDFDKFSLDKIGTGEGAQAYGHGLYFADSEGVAKSYKEKLSGTRGWDEASDAPHVNGRLLTKYHEITASVFMNNAKGDFRDAAAATRRSANSSRDKAVAIDAEIGRLWPWQKEAKEKAQETAKMFREMHADYTKAADQIDKWAASGATYENKTPGQVPGKMYQVRINADPESFLDWDKPLSQQSEKVRGILEQAASPQGLRHASSTDAQILSGSSQRPTILDQGDGSLNGPSSGVVQQRMGSMVDNGQVLNSVVGLVPVDMMNVLGGKQGTPQMVGHDAPMLFDKLPVAGGDNVSLGVDGALASKGSIAGTATEGFGVRGNVSGGAVKGFPALSADQLRHMTGSQLLDSFASRDAATEVLRNQGIAGVKYLDQVSRSAGEGSRNYVIFNAEIIDIVKKYGIAPAAAMYGMEAVLEATNAQASPLNGFQSPYQDNERQRNALSR
jgi:hypothetical protein